MFPLTIAKPHFFEELGYREPPPRSLDQCTCIQAVDDDCPSTKPSCCRALLLNTSCLAPYRIKLRRLARRYRPHLHVPLLPASMQTFGNMRPRAGERLRQRMYLAQRIAG